MIICMSYLSGNKYVSDDEEQKGERNYFVYLEKMRSSHQYYNDRFKILKSFCISTYIERKKEKLRMALLTKDFFHIHKGNKVFTIREFFKNETGLCQYCHDLKGYSYNQFRY